MNKRVTILLGSGATLPWGAPKTFDLTKKLIGNSDFKTKEGQNLACYIYQYLTSYYNGRSKEINFETIIHTLESLVDYYVNKTSEGAGPNFISSFPYWFETNRRVDTMMNYKFTDYDSDRNRVHIHNLANGEIYSGYPKDRAEAVYLGEAIKKYLEIICFEINRYDSDCLDEKFKCTNKGLINFLKCLINKGYQPRIYTLNYDLLFPKIFSVDKNFDFFNGFDNYIGNNNMGKIFSANIPRILNDDICLNYYNLHGSIYWEYTSDEPEIRYQFVCTPDDYHPYPHYNNSEYTNPGSDTPVYNIVTGYNKLQRISIEPLNSFHAIYTKDCINSDLIITIGYSFSDFHINRPIFNSMRLNDHKLLYFCTSDKDLPVKNKHLCKDFENFICTCEWLNSCI